MWRQANSRRTQYAEAGVDAFSMAEMKTTGNSKLWRGTVIIFTVSRNFGGASGSRGSSRAHGKLFDKCVERHVSGSPARLREDLSIFGVVG